MGFDSCDRVEATGQSGGIWLLWHSDACKLVVVEKNDQFIHATIGEGGELFHVICVYACPMPQRRAGLWQLLSTTVDNIVEPIVFGGDFNSIIGLEERQGGSGGLCRDSVQF